jgi:SRSO17 transposase
MAQVIDVIPELPSPRELTAADVLALAEELVTYQQHFAPFFRRREQREWAAVYLRGLLTADVPRKNIEAMALRLLGVGPDSQRQVRALQQFISEGAWDDAALLADHRRLVHQTLFEEDGVLIIDGSEVPKHGSHSVGVARQWCGTSGKTENCQAGVYLGYASRKGAALLDRRLYLPKPWFAAERRADWKACRIPEGMPFQTKHELAAQMVERVRAEPHLRTSWLVCDEWYGDSPLFLDRVAATGLWYVAEVSRTTSVWPLMQPDGKLVRARPRAYVPPRAGSHGRHRSRLRLHPSSPAFQSAEHLISQWPARAWKRYRVLEGHKGPLVAEFLALRAVAVRDGLPGPEVWLLIRHKISGPEDVPEWKFYLSNAPIQTSLTALVRVIGMRWPIERCFADCKGELGLDHYELRTWQGWHHHQTLVLLAHHFLVRCRLWLDPREGGPAGSRALA